MTQPGPKVTAPQNAAEPVRFAAAELQRYVAAIVGRNVDSERRDLPPNTLVLGSSPPSFPQPPTAADAFVIAPSEDGAVIRGESARACLHGVYALLEQLGCRWSLHGSDPEQVPRHARLPAINAGEVAPRLAVRGYSADIMTWHYGDPGQLAEHLAADRAFIDWMGKSGANAFLFIRHPFDSQLTIPELIPEFARRGIGVEYGGHVIPLLLPRELFRQRPDFFPQSSAGERRDFGNLCTSSAEAIRVASGNAVRYVHDHPELAVLHIWGADLWEGGWCHCAGCAGLTVQDQGLRLCNAVAESLAREGVPRPVCYLAYHDTIEPDLRERPGPGVCVEFAPRERCYGHALDDRTCATNQRYRAALERYAEIFDGRVRIFEYYADAILFCGCAVPLVEVIAADLDYYHRLGIREITNLQFGGFSLWAYGVNFLAFAAATRTGGLEPGKLRAQCAERSGAAATAVRETLAGLETVMRGVVTYGDIRRPPRQAQAAERLRPRLEGSIEHLTRLMAGLGPHVGNEPVAALHALLRYNHAMLVGVRRELEGEAGEAEYESALAIMGAVDRRFTGLWGAVDLPVIHAYHSRVRAA